MTPNQFLYLTERKARREKKKVNEVVNLFAFDAMYRKHVHEESKKLLVECCQLTGHIAIGAGKITEHMKAKYSSQRVKMGRNTFYLFKRDEIPADVFYKVVKPFQDQDVQGQD